MPARTPPAPTPFPATPRTRPRGDAPTLRFGLTAEAAVSLQHALRARGAHHQTLRQPLAGAPAANLAPHAAPLADGQVRVQRWVWQGRTDQGLIAFELDRGHATAGGLRSPVRGLQMRLLAGPPDSLFEMAAGFLDHGGLWLDPLPLVARAGAQLSPPGATTAARLRLHRSRHTGRAPRFMRAVLDNVMQQVLPNAAAVAWQGGSAEAVHQLRVGLRRLRTVVRELQALVTGTDLSRCEAPLAQAFAALAGRRDQDALDAAVAPLLASCGTALRHCPSAGAPPADPAEVVRQPAFQATLLQMLALSRAGDEAFAPLSPADTRRTLLERIGRLKRQVTHRCASFESWLLQEQHRARKRLKRLRYLTEFAQALPDGRTARRQLSKLLPAQEALGRFNDLSLAAQRFERMLPGDPRAAEALRCLQPHLRDSLRQARRALQALK